jgi:hypothetical protein
MHWWRRLQGLQGVVLESFLKIKKNVLIIILNKFLTLPNFIERKHPRKGEKRKQGARTEVQASKQSNKGVPQGGKGTTTNQTLQFCYQRHSNL